MQRSQKSSERVYLIKIGLKKTILMNLIRSTYFLPGTHFALFRIHIVALLCENCTSRHQIVLTYVTITKTQKPMSFTNISKQLKDINTLDAVTSLIACNFPLL